MSSYFFVCVYCTTIYYIHLGTLYAYNIIPINSRERETSSKREIITK